MLSFLGHTMNVMTLGGLALAIGILVDDATVTIENIHRHMGRKPLREAVLDGAAQIATPTFVATLTICIVFVSVVFLTGPAKYLFTPHGTGGSFRDDRELYPVAHPGSGDGGIPAAVGAARSQSGDRTLGSSRRRTAGSAG